MVATRARGEAGRRGQQGACGVRMAAAQGSGGNDDSGTRWRWRRLGAVAMASQDGSDDNIGGGGTECVVATAAEAVVVTISGMRQGVSAAVAAAAGAAARMVGPLPQPSSSIHLRGCSLLSFSNDG